MRTAIVRRADVLRAQLEVLLLAEHNATPGPWDLRDGWVVAPSVPMVEARYPIDSYEFYGGELICESVKRADAVVVAAARNILPDLAREHLAALNEIDELRRQLRYVLIEALHRTTDFADLVNSCGYRVAFVPKAA